MLRRHLEDRMLYLAFRRGWLRHGSLPPEVEPLLDEDPALALKRLVELKFLDPHHVKDLERDARSELSRFLDLTQDMARMPDQTLTSDSGRIRAVPATDTGEFRIWAKAAGVVEGEPWGPYRILGLVGEGSVGRVFRALDPDLGRPVALKILQRTDPTTLERFLNEARAQARIEHPCVAKVYRVGEEAGQPYIAMQFVDGLTLREAAPKLDLEEKVRLMAQVCEGVHAAHRLGIVHRDLKPSNIMLERADGGWRPVVLDFGLALTRESSGLTLAGHAVGTPKYMSPEQWKGLPLDRRSDVYSLGVSLYEILCGRAPFEGDHPLEVLRSAAETEPPRPRSLKKDLPADLETILLKALEKEPARRYDSAKALAQDLDRYLEGEPIAAKPPTRADLARRWFRRNRLAGGIAAASLLLILAVGGWATLALLRSRAQARAARLFGAQSERVEVLLAKAYALPKHDVSRTEDEVRRGLEILKGDMARLGREAEGPGLLALGRAHRALGDLEEAHLELAKAWEAGYRGPEVAAELGLVKAGLYRRLLAPLSGADRQERRRQLDESLLRPAQVLLRIAPAASLRPSELAAAELALTEGRHEEALRLADEAYQAQPWLFEALSLKAEVRMAQADDDFEGKRMGEAEEHLQKAAEDLARAKEIGRSAPSVYLLEARRRAEWIRVRTTAGKADPRDRELALAACDEAQALRPSSWAARLVRAAVHLHWAPSERQFGRDLRPELQLGVAAAEDALRLAPESNEVLAALAFLWWRWAAEDEIDGLDPRRALSRSLAALEKGLKHPEEAPTLHLRMGNCYTTQAIFELRSGVDPEPSVAQAELHYRESARLKPSGQPLSDLIWVLAVRAQARLWRGEDPTPVAAAAEPLYAEANRLMPSYFFTKINLADVRLAVAEHRAGRGLDPAWELARTRELGQAALADAPARAAYALPILGRTALLRGEWLLRQGADPSEELKDARQRVEEALRLRPGRGDNLRLLLRVRLAELRALPAWDAPRFEALSRDLHVLADKGDAEASLLLGRLEILGSQRGALADRSRHRAASMVSLRRCKELNPNLAALADAALREGEAAARAADLPDPARRRPSTETPDHGL
ncbi:MAG: protein kinase [Holophagaceae bacterium]